METHIRKFSLLTAVVIPSLALAQAPRTSDAPVGAGVASGSAPVTTHNCVVIVFDDSGSMDEDFGGQRRMDAAKRGLKVVLRSVARDTWIGLYALNAEWQYDLGPLDQARLSAVIDRMETNGGTPLARSIKAGADRLMAEREKQFGYGSYRLLVVTDGQETANADLIETYPPEVRSRGLTLDVIGVGIGQGHSLRQHAHAYRSADNPNELERAIREVFAERIDTNVTGGEDGFALIAGLDPGVAQAMVTALGKMPNHPIGTQPPIASTGGGGSSGGGGGSASSGSGNSPQPPGACGCRLAASPQPPAASIGLFGLLVAWLALRRLRLARVRVRSDRR